MKLPEHVKIGQDHRIETGVELGYLPGRKIADLSLTIGKNAVLRTGSVIYAGTKIGDHFESGHNVVIREDVSIGDGSAVWSNSVVDYSCRIGSKVKIHNNCYIAQFTNIEDDVFIGPGVITANDPHPVCTKCMKGPTIKRGAKIGANVTILPRVTIGEYALVGAGSVVTKDVPPRSVVYGNPARVIKSVEDLECGLNIVDKPYINGDDVRSREH
ncbi:MAG: DapH/DapD/GlmU-related protein [Candidatus Omnitrophica bacterium]|nr:DapH/DapD/GlmU-related protein [Candidatus Omnitrophota bacterium]MDD5552655.1 DapH/DapD/GlmU-related protein [Candidatus Omnitrophota bacterium]